VTSVPINARADTSALAELRVVDGRTVAWFRIAGGKHHGAIGLAGAAAVERAVQLAGDLSVPLVGELDTSGADLREGISALHAWGRLARAVTRVSGRVPTIACVTGACVSGPALALGLFDHVIMTEDAFAYVTGPDTVAEFTGVTVTRDALGGAWVHAHHTGVATFVVSDESAARETVAALLSYLPSHHLADPPRATVAETRDRPCEIAAATVPARANASYDVRVVVEDVVDECSFLEMHDHYATNIVTALATLDGRTVGIVANQPCQRAGTIDIEASRKAARFVGWCDTSNVPIVTFVDTPGFEPGRDLEWRGMIRHGAELVHAYAAATVPRVCVVLRKAFGGAYIVMDSRTLGNDFCVAWPGSQIAVMGAAPAVAILNKGREDAALVEEYERTFENPYVAAERGLVDAVIEPEETRATLCAALDLLSEKRDARPTRRHSNTPM
jgi:acetyl-CoA carboxylase carboxyltransferase component